MKHSYTIITDSGSDLPKSLAKELDIDPYTTLMDDIEEMRKVRNELRCVLHITEPCDCSNPKRLDYMNILPACFTAIIDNAIPRRRLYKVIHDAVLDEQMLEIMNDFSLCFRSVRDQDE